MKEDIITRRGKYCVLTAVYYSVFVLKKRRRSRTIGGRCQCEYLPAKKKCTSQEAFKL